MSSCYYHPERPSIVLIEGKHHCWACERKWHSLGWLTHDRATADDQSLRHTSSNEPESLGDKL